MKFSRKGGGGGGVRSAAFPAPPLNPRMIKNNEPQQNLLVLIKKRVHEKNLSRRMGVV